MNILMMTNTFTPHVGGVARSVQAFSEAYRQQGHEVMTIAPEYPNMPQEEENVLRVGAIRRFNHSDFSVRLPIPVHNAVGRRSIRAGHRPFAPPLHAGRVGAPAGA